MAQVTNLCHQDSGAGKAQSGMNDTPLSSWILALVGSLVVHGLLVAGALRFAQEWPRPRRVVEVEAISLTKAQPQPGPVGGGSPAARQPELRPKPKLRPRPRPKKRLRAQPQARPEPPPPPPALAMQRPAPRNAGPRRDSASGSSNFGTASGRGHGTGGGQGTGIGSGRGSGSGPGTGTASVMGSYLHRVRLLLERHKNYPEVARRRNQEGIVILRFTISAHGQIVARGITRSSGHPVLDEAAQETLRRVGRFPPLPPELQRSQLTLEVPLAFRLRES